MSKRRKICIFANSVLGLILAFLGLLANIFGMTVLLLSVLSVVSSTVGFNLGVRPLLHFNPIRFFSFSEPIRDYWDAARRMHLLMRIVLIAMSVLGMWLILTSYMYNLFQNCSKWISEFEYFAWDNRCFWGIIYTLIALVTLWIARAMFLYLLTYNNLSRSQRLALIAILIFLVGTFLRILVHFIPN